jgi:hypothetical protein
MPSIFSQVRKMRQRGRVSAASQSVVIIDALKKISRADAPCDLTDEQSVEWWAIVNRMPAAWFPRETHCLLAQLCRHIVRARRLAQLINAMEKASEFDFVQYHSLLRAEEEQSRAIASLATRLRITQQSTYDKSKKKPVDVKRPWET